MRTRSSVHAQRDTGDEVPDAADDEPVEAPRDQARAHCHPPTPRVLTRLQRVR